MSCNLKSNIKIQSNVVIKSKAENKLQDYIPFDLMRDEYFDVRLDDKLSEQQKKQKLKKYFAATGIIDEDELYPQKNPEMCNSCKFKDICF